MGHVFLIHWKQDEVDSFAEPLRDAGWRVDTAHDAPVSAVERIATVVPDVVVLDLRREPDRSREVARLLAGDDVARDLPAVVVDGDDETIEAVRRELPDVTAVGWPELPATLRELLDAS